MHCEGPGDHLVVHRSAVTLRRRKEGKYRAGYRAGYRANEKLRVLAQLYQNFWLLRLALLENKFSREIETENPALRDMVAQLPRFLMNSRADNTIKKYDSGFSTWSRWAEVYHLSTLPANPLSFALFMLNGIQMNFSFPKLEGIYYAVKFNHEMMDVPDPTKSQVNKNMLQAAKRRCGHQVPKKKSITTDYLRMLLTYVYRI